jgi:Ca2+-transporting ATPase
MTSQEQAGYRATVDEIVERFASDSGSGLSTAEVERRRAQHGANRMREQRSRAAWQILIDQLKSVVVLLLLAATGAAALFGRYVEAAAIAAAVLVNTVIGFSMELRATRAMEALRRMGRVETRVRRDGRETEVDAEALVPGDIVLLDAGDVIAADLRLVEANSLQCDEAALTGESSAVDKRTEALDGELPLAERRNLAYKGTVVTQGSGMGLVIATGMDTEIGRISSLVEAAEQAATPLERRLDRLGQRLVWLTLGIAVVVTGAGFFAGKDLLIMLETAIALAIAAVPEGLPVVATLALAQGMRRMARRNAVVKRLSAVETLGAANLIFSDKTGTLTENHMTLARLALADNTYTVSEDDPGDVFASGALDPDGVPALRTALEIGALCNNASLDDDDGAVGDPTEVALLEAARAAGLARTDLLDELPEAREIGFDPAVRMMATFHRADGGYRVAVKGAPEAVLEHCTRFLGDDGERELDDAGRARWRERGEALADQGLRVLALAQKTVDDEHAEAYDTLVLVGLAGLYDPPRAGIGDSIADCQNAGIRVVMGTGDHAATAHAIAREIGLAEADDTVIEASDLGDLEAADEAQRQRLLDAPVFARISPEQKLELIRLYQDNGHIVGMTGDGVNDAPGLKKADIGIAMGRRGTEAAREAADMVLEDDAFTTIVAAIEHGRIIFQNIRRFIVYLLSGNLGEIMAISAAALVAAPLPMLPLQILYINFVSDVMPALALGLSRGEADVLQRPPRRADEPILQRRHWLAIVGYGALIAAAVLGAFALALTVFDMPTAEAVTIGFLTFGFARLWHVFNMRSADSPLLVNEVTRNGYVWVAILVGIVLLLVATYVPVLAGVLDVSAPGADGWLLCLAFSLLPLLVVQVLKSTGVWRDMATPH